MREVKLSQNSWIALVIAAIIIMSIGVAGAFFSVSLIQEIGASACTESVSGLTTIDGRIGICQGGTEGQVLAKLPSGLIGWADDATVSVTGAGFVGFDAFDDDVIESVALNEIVTLADTNSVFTEASDKLTIDLGANWPGADLADALSADPADCGANTKADSIAANGDLTCSAVDTGDVTDDSLLPTDLNGNASFADEECITFESTGPTLEGQTCGNSFDILDVQFGSDPVADNPNDTLNWTSTGSTIAATGDSGTDTINLEAVDVTCTGCITTGKILNDTIRETDLMMVDAAADGECLTFEATTGDFEWEGCVAGSDGRTILEVDLNAVDAAADEECLTFESTVGDFEWESCISNAFDVLNVQFGSDPVADNPNDTLNWTSTGSTIQMTGDAGTDTVNAEAVDVACTGCITSTKILNDTVLEVDLKSVDAAADEECLTFESAVGDFEWQTCGGGGANSFETQNVPAGTDPVADGTNDTLNWTSTGSTITLTGTSGTDTINVEAVDVTCTGCLTTTEIADDTILEIDLKAVDAAADEECLTFESTVGDFEWQTCGAGGGSPITLDLNDDASLESTAISAIATSGDTNSIFIEPSADKLTVNLAANWPSADTADALSADPTDCGANTKADSIAANGNLTCSAVDTGDIANSTILEIDLAAVDAAADEECLTFESTVGDFEWQTCGGAGANSFETQNVPSGTDPVADGSSDTLNWTSTGATVTLTGDSSTDTVNIEAIDVTCTGCLTTTEILDDTILEVDLQAVDAAVDEECLTYESTVGDFEWQTCGGAGANSFETQDVPSGTDPVADGASDTLAWTSTGSTITLTGDSGTDTINLEAVDVTCTGCIGTVKILNDTILEPDLSAIDAPSDGQCLTYNAAGTNFEWEACGAGGGSAITFDIGDDAGNDSVDVNEIATTGDTNAIFTEPSADKILVNLANNWPSADTADALSADPTDCGANTKADSIVANGNLTCSSVDTGDIADSTILEVDLNAVDAAVDEECLTFETTGSGFEWQTCGGAGANSFETMDAPAGTDPVADGASDTLVWTSTGTTITVTGDSATDTINLEAVDVTCTGCLTTTEIANDTLLEIDLKAVDAAADEECLTFESTVGDFEWQTCGGAGANSFETQNVPAGTDPVADGASDTLNWTSTGATITLTGDSATDTVNLEAVDVTCTGCLTTTEIANDTILEIDLKAVDAAVDEECLTFESTVGDFEWQTCGGSSSNSFETQNVPSGTDPVADGSSDTLNWTSTGATLSLTGDSATDTINVEVLLSPALSANPTDCGANTKADSIVASGNLTCSAVDTGDIADNAISFPDINYTITPAGSPGLQAGEAFFADDGMIFEGATGDSFEGLLTGGDPTSDITWVLPSTAGTIVGTGDTGTVTGTMIANDNINFADINYTGNYPADNPAMIDNEAFFTDIGIVFEGGTTDTIEGVLAPGNITTADRAWVLPDVSGTLITDGDTDTVTATMLDDTDAPADEECLTFESTGSVFEWQTCGAGGSSNSFETQNVPAGTDPVADSATDTFNWTSTGSTITLTGDSATDTVNLEAVDVTCTGCLGTTEIAALDISADTNLTCGRSLTVAGDGCDADAELFTETRTLWFENPTAADDFKTIWVSPTGGGIGYIITSISCESDQTVTFDLQIDDGTPAAVNGSDIACTTFATDATLAGDTSLNASERLDLAITSVAGAPTWVSISWTVTAND